MSKQDIDFKVMAEQLLRDMVSTNVQWQAQEVAEKYLETAYEAGVDNQWWETLDKDKDSIEQFKVAMAIESCGPITVIEDN